MQRYEIVNGVVEVEGVTNESPMDQEEDKATEGIFIVLSKLYFLGFMFISPYSLCMFNTEKGVPNFWLTAMKTNEVLAEEVRDLNKPFFIWFSHFELILRYGLLFTWTLDIRA